ARVGAVVPIDGLAQVDAKPALERFAARQIQGFGKKLCMVCKLSAGDPMAVGRYGESHDQAEQADAEQELDQREPQRIVAALAHRHRGLSLGGPSARARGRWDDARNRGGGRCATPDLSLRSY